MYGCGGGGGYGLADGEAVQAAITRISWNKFWNKDKEEYEITKPPLQAAAELLEIFATYSLYNVQKRRKR